MILQGCQSKSREITIQDKICPQCGHEIEIFSVDTEAVCENCGYVVYNDTLSCVQWCKYAKQCVGEETYERLMAFVKLREQRKAEEAEKQPTKEAQSA